MGLAETVRAGVNTAFTALGNLTEQVTYRRRTGGSYDASTGAIAVSVSDTTVPVVFVDYTFRERQNAAIQPEDRRAIIQGSVIDFQPQVGDELVRVVGGTWDVIDVTLLGTHDDAASAAAWDLHVRRPN